MYAMHFETRQFFKLTHFKLQQILYFSFYDRVLFLSAYNGHILKASSFKTKIELD